MRFVVDLTKFPLPQAIEVEVEGEEVATWGLVAVAFLAATAALSLLWQAIFWGN